MNANLPMTGRQIRSAVIGVGFIGALHVDGLRRLGVDVVGVLASSAEETQARADEWHIARAYADLAELCADPRVDVVHVASPNHLHHDHVMELLAAGKHVVCEKPLALTVAEGQAMDALARERGLVAALCFNVRFYPLLHQMRAMVAAGEIGAPRLVTGGYQQDWLLLDTDWNWRLVPEQAGRLRAVADIGSHLLDAAQFVVGSPITSILADLHTFVPVRRRPRGPVQTFADASADTDRVEVEMTSDDAATLLLRFANGAAGSVVVSQVSPGRKNTLRLDVVGSRAGLEWSSENPEQLWIGHRERANELLARDPSLLAQAAVGVSHYPGGHGEGFAETFLGFFGKVYEAVETGVMPDPAPFATFSDGIAGLRLEEAILESNERGAWAGVERSSPHE